MSICERTGRSGRSGVAVLLGCGLALLTLVRCAPTESCLRLSDCDIGMTCTAGACMPLSAGADLEASVLEGGAPSASPAAAGDATAAGDPTKSGDARLDVATGEASTSADAGDEPIDTSDF